MEILKWVVVLILFVYSAYLAATLLKMKINNEINKPYEELDKADKIAIKPVLILLDFLTKAINRFTKFIN